MPVSDSNRVVVEIDKALKTRLYAALALDSCTLKDWFRTSVEEFLRTKEQALQEFRRADRELKG